LGRWGNREKEAIVSVARPARLRSLVLVLLTVQMSPAADKGDKPAAPTADQIAQWIQQLGDNRFSKREEASRQLWAAGSAAEAALLEAGKSEDVEVARRARDILEKFRWGIYPHTPPEIVALIKAYQASDGNTRHELLQKLLDSGIPGLQAVLKLYRAETDPARQADIAMRIRGTMPVALRNLLTEGDFSRFETLLELGREAQVIHNNDYVAYWLLRGQLDARLAHFQKLQAVWPNERRLAETLAYLYRAKGDLLQARQAAEKSERHELVEGILYEAADWKTLAGRPEVATPNSLEPLAYRAAYARLAGDEKLFQAALEKLRTRLNKDPLTDINSFSAAKAFFLNDRPDEGLAVLARSNRSAMQFEILIAQLKYDEALALIDRPGRDVKEQRPLDLLKARTLYLLGEKEKAQEIFTRCGDEIKEGADASWYENLLDAEYRAGLKDQAFTHCARILEVSRHKDWPSNLFARTFLAKVSPDKTEMADVWWDILRKKYPAETTDVVLQRVRDVIEGKADRKAVKEWLEEADRITGEVPPLDLDRRQQALVEAALAAGLEEQARELMQKANTPALLVRLGDWFAGKKQWEQAALRYQSAWENSLPKKSAAEATSRLDPLPLFLAGWALVQAGQEKEGKKRMEDSHWILLGDFVGRYEFLRALTQRRFNDAAARETELLLRVSEPNSYYAGAALRRLAVDTLARKQYLQAAEGYEQSMLRCLRANTNFVQSGAYVGVPSQVHRLRAQGLVAANRFDEALKEIELARTAMPGSVELPIALVPALEQRQHKKEAARLFEQTVAIYEKLCREYPRCAWGHNSVAWISACCRRNLDRALEHANKAVELAPNTAGYIDTLAEVHFQRGDKDKAIALQKRAIELDPKKVYFRKQLHRLEAGDPTADRPAEDDE
jgi:hypothetical protein